MSTSKKTDTKTASFRERSHRYTDYPVSELLTVRMKELGIKNVDLQKTLGYPAPNVIAMMRRGTMRVPESKAIALADALELDRTFVLGKVVAENDPGLWDAISTTLGDRLVSANERALVELIREALDGHDLDLTESVEFIQAVMPVIYKLVEQQKEQVKAVLNKDDK